jgi:hypothetical protein
MLWISESIIEEGNGSRRRAQRAACGATAASSMDFFSALVAYSIFVNGFFAGPSITSPS